MKLETELSGITVVSKRPTSVIPFPGNLYNAKLICNSTRSFNLLITVTDEISCNIDRPIFNSLTLTKLLGLLHV